MPINLYRKQTTINLRGQDVELPLPCQASAWRKCRKSFLRTASARLAEVARRVLDYRVQRGRLSSMLNGAMTPRIRTLLAIARYLLAALFVKVLASILLEYRGYFPADFDSAFLTGRERIFHGLYSAAFYVHVVTGPMTVVLAALLMWSRGRTGYRPLHRWVGRVQAVLVLGALVPSGLVMARHAFAGPIAAVGFTALSLITAACMVATVYYAIHRRFLLHQRWATRCFIMLVSPLILRVVSGGLIVTHLDAPLAYCLNAWLSWLIPLALYESWWRYRAIAVRRAPMRLPLQLTPEVSL